MIKDLQRPPVLDRADPQFALARELARLRAENDCLKAENQDLRHRLAGITDRSPAERLGIYGQAALILDCLIAHRGAFVHTDLIYSVGRIDGEAAAVQVRNIIHKLRCKLFALAASDGVSFGDERAILGGYGMGYRMSGTALEWLRKKGMAT